MGPVVVYDRDEFNTIEEQTDGYSAIFRGERLGEGKGIALDTSTFMEVPFNEKTEREMRSANKSIFTLVPFKITEVLKGNKNLEGKTINMLLPGGSIGRYTLIPNIEVEIDANVDSVIYGIMAYKSNTFLLPDLFNGVVMLDKSPIEINGEYNDDKVYNSAEEYLRDVRYEITN